MIQKLEKDVVPLQFCSKGVQLVFLDVVVQQTLTEKKPAQEL